MSQVTTAQNGGVLTITLDRLEAKNALSMAMYEALNDALNTLENTPELKVAVIQGSSECFSAGNDLKDFLASPELDTDHPTVKFLYNLANCKKPLIAAVSGPAVGIGTTMLLHCDMVVATNSTRFQLPFSQLGLCPEAGSSLLLPQLAGHARAFELLVLGQPFSAETALSIGLINRIVEPKDVLNTALDFAKQISKLPDNAVLESKKLIKSAGQKQVLTSIETELHSFKELLHGEECKTRVASFSRPARKV